MARADGAVAVRHVRPGRAVALWTLVRGHNGIIAATGVVIGAWWAGGPVGTPVVAWAAVAAFFLACFANAFNDARDLAIDRVVHPDRPLPRGALTAAQARHVWLGSAMLAVVAALISASVLALASIVVLALMWAYSVFLKRAGLAGNLVVAVLASLPFLYGAAAAGGWRSGLALVLAAAPLHLAREIAKDLDDVGGDRGHRRTVPVTRGRPAALTLIVVSAALHVWAVLALARGADRLITFMVPAFVLLALGVRRAALARRGAPLLLKAAMLAAMVALVLARGRLSLA
jgi:geranylgeranylglycerol-phosphate geranylgeranyltransferase